ncbi:unnamed protein product, partial [Effrenium voratum]
WALAVYSRLFKVFAMPSAPGFVCFPNFRYGCLSGGIVSGQSKAYDDPMLSSQDADVRTYLHALARNLQADEGQTKEVDLQGMPSLGSIGHPEVCRRPCIYFSAGHCELGEACNYCHVAHTD